MNKAIVLASLAILTSNSYGQGQFIIGNPTAPTRIWRIDGPLAGPGIWAQMVAGPTPDSLVPVGPAVEHVGSGFISPSSATVESSLSWPDPLHAYVQMLAWNGVIWGTSLEGVPSNQLGKTDVVLTPLGYPPGHNETPRFTRTAIVPAGPPLHIAISSIDTLLLSWPFDGTNYALQQNADLASKNWTTLTNTPIVVDSTNQLTIPIPPRVMFYRLASQ
jgi:hypothetical protein